MKRTQPKITEKVGQPPGSIIYTGEPKKRETGITILQYDKDKVSFKECRDIAELIKEIDKDQINWINIDSLHDVELISNLGQHFNIHPLTLEDIVHVGHQPKMEVYDNYLFFTLKMIWQNEDDQSFRIEHYSYLILENVIISFQEHSGDPFDTIRERIKSGKSKARIRGADYLFYLLIDVIADRYLLTIEANNKFINALELEIFENPKEEIVSKILEYKKVIAELRNIILPLRDELKKITSGDIEFINEDYQNYFNDIFGHVKSTVDYLDNQKEALTSLMEFYATQISTQMNKVMQSLTIVATIFIPLTFLAGIYGMNFQFMPELGWEWSYPILLFSMLVIGVIMFFYMRRKRWF